MIRRCLAVWWMITALLAISIGSTPAQTGLGSTQATTPSRYPPALPKRRGPFPPPLAFRVVASIALPGKLSGAPPWLDSGTIRVPLESGRATIDASAQPPTASLDPDSPPVASEAEEEGVSNWVEDPTGKRRVRSTSAGEVEAQHRCKRCKTGWRKEWRARLPGAAGAAPLIAGGKVFVGTTDARVHCLKLENGHRLWATDVGERVRRPVVLWSGKVKGEKDWADLPVSLILVLGQEGGTLTGLDPYDGRKLATFELHPSEGRFATAALAVDNGTIAVARETYAKPEGELLLFAVERAPEQPKPEPKDPYGKVSASRNGR